MVRGTKGNFRKKGVDPQEAALNKITRISSAAWGQEPAGDWGMLHVDAEGSMVTRPLATKAGDYRRFYAGVRDALETLYNRDMTAAQESMNLDLAALRIAQRYDVFFGGMLGGVKFLNPLLLDVLWRAFLRTGTPQFSQIIFTSLASGDLDIWSMNTDGSGKKQLTNGLGYDGGPVFSRDGKKMVWRAYLYDFLDNRVGPEAAKVGGSGRLL